MTKKIMVIEDDQFLIDSYKAKLEKEEYEVTVAHDGLEALSALSSKIPDLIILDIVMPKMDGITFLKKIKSDPKFKNIPVLMASNIDTHESVIEAMKAGAKDYFIKSNISINDLVAKCRNLLAG